MSPHRWRRTCSPWKPSSGRRSAGRRESIRSRPRWTRGSSGRGGGGGGGGGGRARGGGGGGGDTRGWGRRGGRTRGGEGALRSPSPQRTSPLPLKVPTDRFSSNRGRG